MATDKDPPKIELIDKEQTHDHRQEDSHVDINYNSNGEEFQSTPLKLTRVCYKKVRSKFKNHRCCLWSSKAVVLILVWNLIISVAFKSFFDPSLYTTIIKFGNYEDYYYEDYYYEDYYYEDYYYDYISFFMLFGLSYGISALLLIFYPLLGFLADVCWGRYTTVRNGLYFLIWSIIIMIVLTGLALLGSIPMFFLPDQYYEYSISTIEIITIAVLCIVFGVPVLLGAILFICSTVAFNANVIQFGIDQLHDAPTDSLILYIQWYVWTNQMGLFLIRLPSAFAFDYDSEVFVYFCSPALVLLALVFLAATLCLEKYKRHWFLIEPGSTNPYKLVYKVIKFARDHTNPIRRSAFTYCEDELPSRLDLGKEKYGGPYTTEEVENVKAFLGIVRVLLTVGPIFFVEIAFSENLPGLVQLSHYYYDNYYGNITLLKLVPSYAYFYGSGCLTPLLILILIPLYLCLLRPFIHDYIPGMLKRMGLGMVLHLISGLCTLLMGVANHNCAKESCTLTSYFKISSHFLLFQYSFNAVRYLLIYVASYEFICAQSPHSMKGLLVGTFFAIKGVFQLLGVLLLYAPIGVGCNIRHHFPVCGFIYYLINVVVALTGIIAFVLVARKYQYRQRDEPDNIYRYAEEYYANAQDEPNYDYDDYDNLNVETIQN